MTKKRGITAGCMHGIIFSIIKRAWKSVVVIDWKSVNTYIFPLALLAIHMVLLIARYIRFVHSGLSNHFQ